MAGAIPVWFNLEVSNIGFSIQLAFSAVIFFIFSLIFNERNDPSFSSRWEIINDKFIIFSFFFYIVVLLGSLLISLVKFNNLDSTWYKGFYVFINFLSLCLAFNIFLFFVQLINPIKNGIYCVSKIKKRNLLKYGICSVKKKKKRLVFTRNYYSLDQGTDDPLTAVHDSIMPLIKQFDYRGFCVVFRSILKKKYESSLTKK